MNLTLNMGPSEVRGRYLTYICPSSTPAKPCNWRYVAELPGEPATAVVTSAMSSDEILAALTAAEDKRTMDLAGQSLARILTHVMEIHLRKWTEESAPVANGLCGKIRNGGRHPGYPCILGSGHNGDHLDSDRDEFSTNE